MSSLAFSFVNCCSTLPVPPNRMKSPPSSLISNQHATYIRSRHHPIFDGMRRGDAATGSKPAIFDFKSASLSYFHSKEEIGDEGMMKTTADTSEEIPIIQSNDSPTDIIFEPLGLSSAGRWLKENKNKLQFSCQSDFSMEYDGNYDSPKESSSAAPESDEHCYILSAVQKPAIKKSYSVKRRRANVSRIPLAQSAASFYDGHAPQMEIVELCESIQKLNLYLKARRNDVNAGVPGKLLHGVIGQDICDVGSVASTIMYAFYLNETLGSSQLCTVPVINVKRAEMNSHPELKWLFESCQIDQASLIFVDEIDLSYYDLYGSLKLVLVNGDKLPALQEPLKGTLVEIFNANKDCSCCTLIAEKFALSSPELSGILFDTGNLTNPECSLKDKYMATLLLNGAGRFGCNGLFQILKYKMYDVSDLKVGEILRKDFKKWTKIGKPQGVDSRLVVSHIGMSSIGVPIAQFLAHDDRSTFEIVHFQQIERLRLFMVVSGYYDNQKDFKREILVAAESTDLMKNLLQFFDSNASQLPLKVLPLPGLTEEMIVFEIDKVTSRKTIEKLLDEFGETSKV